MMSRTTCMSNFTESRRLSLALTFLLLGLCRARPFSQPGRHRSLAETQAAASTPPPEPPPDIGGVGDEVPNPSAYDSHPSMFSPNGRLLQIEYAMTAVSHGKPIIGIRTSEGVVLAGRKALESTKLQDARLGQKIYQVDWHVLVAVTGVLADALALVRLARTYAQDYRRTYGEPIPVRHLVERLCDVKHMCTMIPRRPFGVSMLFAGWDPMRGYQLYKTDPSANYGSWLAVAVGEGQEGLTTRLTEALVPSKTLSSRALDVGLPEACELACKLLLVEGEEDGASQARALELAVVTRERCQILGRHDDVKAALGLPLDREEGESGPVAPEETK